MKLENLLLPLGIVAVVAIAFFAYSATAAPLPEGFPPPTPEGQIEVKQYPAYRSATVRYSGELSMAANRALVGSRGSIISRPSQLAPDVRLLVHPAPDVLSLSFCSCECNRGS